jgi:hypothetical protein
MGLNPVVVLSVYRKTGPMLDFDGANIGLALLVS